MKYEIKAKQISGSNFTYTLLKNDEIVASAGQRHALVNIIKNAIDTIMLEKDTIIIN